MWELRKAHKEREAGRWQARSSPHGLLSDATLYGGATLTQRGISFLLLPFLTRILGPFDYGVVGTATALAGVLWIIYNLGLTFSVVRLYYDEPSDSRQTSWAALVRAQAVLASILAALTWLTGPAWAGLISGVPWSATLQITILYAWAFAIQQSAQQVLRAMQRPRAFAVVAIVQVAVGGVSGVALARTYGPAGYMSGLTVGAVASGLIAIALSYTKPIWNWEILRSGFILSTPMIFHQLASWVLSLSDRVLIARYGSLQDVANYHVAYVLGAAMLLVLTSLNSAWAPRYYGAFDVKAKHEAPGKLILPLTALFMALAGLLVIIAPLLFRAVTTPEFAYPRLVLALVAASTSVQAAYFLGVAVLIDAKESGRIATASVTAAVLNIVLNVLLIPPFGIVAAAITTLVAFIAQSIFVLARSAQKMQRGLPLGRLLGIWFSSAAIFSALALVPLSSGGWLARLLIGMGLMFMAWRAFSLLKTRYIDLIADKPVSQTHGSIDWQPTSE